jgi:hypothetical protein
MCTSHRVPYFLIVLILGSSCVCIGNTLVSIQLLISESSISLNSTANTNSLTSQLWDVVASGGNKSSNGELVLLATFGQSGVGQTSNESTILVSGFWQSELRGFLCGDANRDNFADISDVVYLIAYIFSGGLPPSPLLAGDANCDSMVDISDVVYLIAYIFSGGQPPCATCP